ncbi:hypothetical protein KYH19_06775 [Pedobacter sp. D749]|nr:hypothetical protein KYH19_06775 [Pedobacter sp. D749]
MWYSLENRTLEWKDEVNSILNRFVNDTPGAFIK